MGTRSRLLLNQQAFTADTTSLPIPADNIENLQIGLMALDGGTACKTDLTNLIDEIIVTLGGHNICKMLYMDLVALDMLYWGHYPQLILGGTTNLLDLLGGVMLPLHATKGGRALNVQVTWGATANLGTPTLSLEYQYQETPFPRHLCYQYEQQLGAANLQWNGLQRVGAALQALLIYNELEDCGTAATLLPEISELFMFVDDREVYHANIGTFKEHHNAFAQTDLTAGYGPDFASEHGFSGNVGGHYKLIVFPEPWRADDIRVVTNNTCGAYAGGSNGDCRILGIYNEK